MPTSSSIPSWSWPDWAWGVDHSSAVDPSQMSMLRSGHRWVLLRHMSLQAADSAARAPSILTCTTCDVFVSLGLHTFGLSCCAEASWPSRSSSDKSSITRRSTAQLAALECAVRLIRCLPEGSPCQQKEQHPHDAASANMLKAPASHVQARNAADALTRPRSCGALQ